MDSITIESGDVTFRYVRGETRMDWAMEIKSPGGSEWSRMIGVEVNPQDVLWEVALMVGPTPEQPS